MMTPISFYLYALAVFGLTFIVRRTNGPGDIFLKFRMFMGITYFIEYVTDDELIRRGEVDSLLVKDRTENRVYEYHPWYTKLMHCPWCFGTWVSAMMMLYIVLTYSIPLDVAFFNWLAAIGVNGSIFAVVDRLHRE